MGSTSSYFSTTRTSDEYTLPVTERRVSPYQVYGVPTPTEASIAPEDTRDWYADFWEKAYCVPHKDGQNIIIFEPVDTLSVPETRCRIGWPIKRLRKAYELLGDGHPRIVRCVELDDYRSLLKEIDLLKFYTAKRETVWSSKDLIQAQTGGKLPVMRIPVARDLSWEDRINLSLRYRWALQALSALIYCHSKSVHIRTFTAGHVWLRSDYSLAITGFICATAPEIEQESEQDGAAYIEQRKEIERDFIARCKKGNIRSYADVEFDDNDIKWQDPGWNVCEWISKEEFSYDDYRSNGVSPNDVHEDLFYWATFVWRLMSEDCTRGSKSGWVPTSPLDDGPPLPDAPMGRDELEKISQELDEARLEPIVLKAWRSEYESADDVAQDVRKLAEKMGIKVDGDEVDIGQPWEEVFELVAAEDKGWGQSLRFKTKEKM